MEVRRLEAPSVERATWVSTNERESTGAWRGMKFWGNEDLGFGFWMLNDVLIKEKGNFYFLNY